MSHPTEAQQPFLGQSSSPLESIHSTSMDLSPLAPFQPFEYARFELPITRVFPNGYFKGRNRLLACFSARIPGLSYQIGPVLLFFLFSLGFILAEAGFFFGNGSFFAGGKGLGNGKPEKGIRNLTGGLAAVAIGLALTLASRNSIWAVLLGIPFERGLFWHKFFAYWGVVLAVLHAISDDFGYDLQDWSGLVLISLMVLTAVFSFFPIRRRFFGFFQVSHWVFFVLIVIMACVHGAGGVILGICLFFVDLAIRARVIYKNKKLLRRVCVEKLPFEVLRVGFPKRSLRYKPGQYCFLCFPDVSYYEFHPFSISSSPSDEQVLLHLRVVGDWTKRLAEGLPKTVNNEVRMYLDGPYGNPNEFIDSDEVKVFLMVSGGIGVTPLQSICRELISQKARGRNVKRIMFVWSVRDKNLLNSDDLGEFYRRDLPIVFQPDILEVKEDEVLMSYFHLTQARSETEFYKGNIHPSKQKSLRMGRPNIEDYVKQAYDFAIKNGESKVGVLSCGPEPLVNDVKQQCWKLQGKKVEFLFHEEVFEF